MKRRKFITVFGTAIAMTTIIPCLVLGEHYEFCEEAKILHKRYKDIGITHDKETLIAQDIYIRRMKKNGTWDKLDSLYRYDTTTKEEALINWVNP